ncbi:acetylglutamate kinase [uncultured Clostridium sp.]|jgi:acetylglutamate kinase|uniref:acetylglutamate kinase n=1 Tax=uncultured Clostridium sp. TaxID=59620 RepID=UPI0026298594|nr:acetylglutamate kinase [uncultured Clostridium sp.]
MKISNLDKANTLIQALPYIQQYNDKVMVVKYGGNAMKNETLKEAVIKDIILMSCVGIKVILVHGGGPDINKVLKKVGKESEFINGLRYTDKETMEVVQMVLAGKVNKELVALINKNGGNAIGLCGIDGNMMKSEKKIAEVDLGYVGDIVEINSKVILDALKNNYISVVATVAQGLDGNIYNVNADTAASKIAAAINAEKIILLTDVPGLMLDIEDNDTLISNIDKKNLYKLIDDNIIKGGMIPKIECCMDALEHGVGKAHIIDGRIPHTILLELFSETGIGTMIEIGEGNDNE